MLHEHATNTFIAILKVAGSQFVFLLITLMDVNLWFKISAGVITFGYAIWKWRRDIVVAKREDDKIAGFVESEIQRRVEEHLKKTQL